MEGLQVSAKAAGEVTLIGFVRSERDVKTAQAIADDYPEVCKLDNLLRVVSGV